MTNQIEVGKSAIVIEEIRGGGGGEGTREVRRRSKDIVRVPDLDGWAKAGGAERRELRREGRGRGVAGQHFRLLFKDLFDKVGGIAQACIVINVVRLVVVSFFVFII